METASKGGLIFVSCGQHLPHEKQLGADICALIRELTPHQPYFAEYQNSLDAFTRNILGALDDAVALVAVMHPRGVVSFPDGQIEIRASVWIEQEIAMASYITQILRRPLKVAPYIHQDIRREGMREQLQLNAFKFKEDSEVLEHLRTVLPGWKDLPSSLKILAPPRVRISLKHGHASNFTFVFTNDEEEELFIREILLEANGVLLTEPIVPNLSRDWRVPPQDVRGFGKTIVQQRNPAVSLMRMNSNIGMTFNTFLDVILTVEFRSQLVQLRQKLYVRVEVASKELLPMV